MAIKKAYLIFNIFLYFPNCRKSYVVSHLQMFKQDVNSISNIGLKGTSHHASGDGDYITQYASQEVPKGLRVISQGGQIKMELECMPVVFANLNCYELALHKDTMPYNQVPPLAANPTPHRKQDNSDDIQNLEWFWTTVPEGSFATV